MLTIGFAVGMTGPLAPVVPMLFATIDTSLKKGWQAGPDIFIGHAIPEFLVCILIIFGITATSAPTPYLWLWWLAAGSALVLRGLE